MFHIYLDGDKLHIPDNREFNKLASAVLEQELNKAGAFNIKVPRNHWHYSEFRDLSSRITVYDDDDLIFKGRVIKQGLDFRNTKTVTAEGEFAYFNDSVYQASATGEYSSVQLIPAIIENHNSQVDDSRQFQIGEIDIKSITVPDTNFYRSMDFLQNVIVKTYGGYFFVRYEDDVRYLDYKLVPGEEVSEPTIRFGVNLLDLNEYIDATELYTCVIPYGDFNEYTGRPLDIYDVNGGQIYVENAAAVEQFGRIFKAVEFKGVTDPETLMSLGYELVESIVAEAVTLDLTALEMRRIDFRNPESIFKLGNFYRLISTPHGMNEFFLCSKKKTDLFVPENNKVQLGHTRKRLTDYI